MSDSDLLGRVSRLADSLKRIIVNPKVMVGKPVIRGTRIPVYLILELLASGMTEKELLQEYPALSSADIKATNPK